MTEGAFGMSVSNVVCKLDNKNTSREIWIDLVKLYACTLVAAGHFFQSMVASCIMTESPLYLFFNRTIYYFHVPLFFICSGYLYQKHGAVSSFSQWKENAVKKFISLGIPYCVFSTATWLLKAVFSGAVNIQNDGFFTTLLVHPISPYWYLYTLFFIFLVIPTIHEKKTAVYIILVVSIGKMLDIAGVIDAAPYAVKTVCAYAVWFVAGMLLAFRELPKKCNSLGYYTLGIAGCALFTAISGMIQVLDIYSQILDALMGVLGCASFLLIAWNFSWNKELRSLTDFCSGYTMPVFLMHTIFAAGFRAILLKIGVSSLVIHVGLGLIISFVGPMAAFDVMQKLKLDWLIFPTKYIQPAFWRGRKNG